MQPTGAIDYQDAAVLNIKLMLRARGEMQKDLAAYMGKNPQSLSRMMRPGYAWSFNDMCKAAAYFGVSIDTLLRSDLTISELMGMNQNGGLPVVNIDDSRRRSGVWIWRALSVILAA